MTDKRRRKWVLVLPVAGLGIGYLLFLGYLLWGDALGLTVTKTTAPPTPTHALVGLWDAYDRACAAAHAQAEDARLVSASTQWQTASEQTLLAGASNWSFVFYSPTSGHSVDVVVNAGAARVVSQTRVWVAPEGGAHEGSWRAGPEDALRAFLASGGRAFLDEHPQAVVDLHVAHRSQGGAVWTVVALDPADRSLLSLSVDAETGRTLSNSS
jgi:hypothetical protein